MGLFGKIFGLGEVIVTKIVGQSEFHLADPDWIGVMPVRQEITVLPADEPRRMSVGWRVEEIIGQGIVCAPETAAQKRKRISANLLLLRLVERDGGWALVAAPLKQLPPYRNMGNWSPFLDYMPSLSPDYSDLGHGTVKHWSQNKAELEKMLFDAQTVLDESLYEERHHKTIRAKLKRWLRRG